MNLNEPEKFLFMFRIEDDAQWCARLSTIAEIAEVVGCSDFNESHSHQVYRLLAGNPQKLEIRQDYKHSCVDLYDRFGNYVDSANYPEH